MNLKQIIFLIAFLEGGIVMLLELSIPHVVAPILGNSLSLWGILIAFSAGSLAIGYFLGSFLSNSSNILWRLSLLFAVSFLALFISSLLIQFQNFYALFESEATTSYLVIFSGLILPTICMGASTPMVIEYLNSEHNNQKVSPGIVYSYSTWGGVLFTLFTGYSFIPDLGLIASLNIALVLLALIALYLLIQDKHPWKIPMLVSLPVVLIIHFLIDFSTNKNDKIKILEFTEGINGQLMVTEQHLNDSVYERTLYINRMGQTKVSITNNASISSYWSYPAILKSLASINGKKKQDALVLGLGGGIVPFFLNDKSVLNFSIDAVELDDKIIALSKKYFFLPNSINVVEDDARRYLNKNKVLYDLIVMDVFNGEIAPSHVLSLESFEKVQKSLTKDGILLINFNGNISGEAGISGRSLYATLTEAGFVVDILPTWEEGERYRNNIFIASYKPLDYSKRTFKVDFGSNGVFKEYDITENLLDIDEIDFSDAVVITDDFPLMEQLNQKAAQQWREDYLESFTLNYRSMGIPLLK